MPELAPFVAQGAAELLEFGQRLGPTLRTLVFRPGALTRDFVEGRRGAATHPVRLFVVAGALAFLADRVSRSILFILSLLIVSEAVGQEWAVTATLLVVVPTTAILLKALYFGTGVRFLAHLVFSIHVFTFLLILSVAESFVDMGTRGFAPVNWMPAVTSLGIGFGYTLTAMRVFYRKSWWAVTLRMLTILLVYVGMMSWLINFLI